METMSDVSCALTGIAGLRGLEPTLTPENAPDLLQTLSLSVQSNDLGTHIAPLFRHHSSE